MKLAFKKKQYKSLLGQSIPEGLAFMCNCDAMESFLKQFRMIAVLQALYKLLNF